MTSEPPAAAGAGDDAAAAVRATTHALAVGISQPTRRRRYRRAKFLRLSTGRFVAITLVLIGTNLAASLFGPLPFIEFSFRRIDWLFVLGMIHTVLMVELSCVVLWSLAQRKVRFAIRSIGAMSASMAVILVGTGFYPTAYDAAQVMIVVGLTSALQICLGRSGWRLLQSPRRRIDSIPKIQFSLRTMAYGTLGTSVVLALRTYLPLSASDGLTTLDLWLSVIEFATVRALLPIAVAIGCFGIDRAMPRLVYLLAVTIAITALPIFWSWPQDIPLSESNGFLLWSLAFAIVPTAALAAVLLVVRHVYGLRLVRVPRKVARSLE